MAALTETAEKLVAGLNEKFAGSYTFVATAGHRYDKIQCRNLDGGGPVHAFVNRATGFVHKPASYRRPAPGPRYTTAEAAVAAADPYGGYLYARR